jgi:hypothetical protein
MVLSEAIGICANGITLDSLHNDAIVQNNQEDKKGNVIARLRWMLRNESMQ